LHIDVLQIGQLHGAHMAHRLQHTAAVGALAVAPGNRRIPVGGCLQGLGQHGFDALHQLLGTLDQALQRVHHILHDQIPFYSFSACLILISE
jgi:hypothetical protein